MPRPVFLRAAWRHLVMLNYACDPALLQARVPVGTELDFFGGTCYVSMVGFRFLNTRVLGMPIPFHVNFDEVNLRFYVRREHAGELRRSVVFVKELVPRFAIAEVARRVYNEPYEAVPMNHRVDPEAGEYEYTWRFRGHECALGGIQQAPLEIAQPESEAAFITEHYWGYTRLRDGSTAEYQVEHPTWRTAPLAESHFEANVAALYGPEFVSVLDCAPKSALVAEGSDILVRRGARLSG